MHAQQGLWNKDSRARPFLTPARKAPAIRRTCHRWSRALWDCRGQLVCILISKCFWSQDHTGVHVNFCWHRSLRVLRCTQLNQLFSSELSYKRQPWLAAQRLLENKIMSDVPALFEVPTLFLSFWDLPMIYTTVKWVNSPIVFKNTAHQAQIKVQIWDFKKSWHFGICSYHRTTGTSTSTSTS
jgi:hypothetical protein